MKYGRRSTSDPICQINTSPKLQGQEIQGIRSCGHLQILLPAQVGYARGQGSKPARKTNQRADAPWRMLHTDWKQWAKERPLWICEDVKEALWRFVDQKKKDALNVAATEPGRKPKS